MAVAGYKTYRRGLRGMTVEESFAKGMRYTDTPLAEGFCKAMANYDFRDDGQVLVPRGGFRRLREVTRAQGTSLTSYRIHHAEMGLITDQSALSDINKRYIFFVGDPDMANDFELWLDLDTGMVRATLALATPPGATPPEDIINATDSYKIRFADRILPERVHDQPVTDLLYMREMTALPVYTMLNGKALLPVSYRKWDTASWVDGLAWLQIEYDSATGSYSWTPEFIDPMAVTPTEAMNYGYNMLSSTPYAFADTETGSTPGYATLQGILPYADEACTIPKFNGRVGERITFRAFIDYADSETDTFQLRWEFQEIGSGILHVVQDQRNSPQVSATVAATLTTLIPAKKFSVSVSLYNSSDLTDPLQVMIFGAYTAADDSNKNTGNLEVRTYNLDAAGGMCTWRQRVVLWGIPGADNMLFVSDINNPSYFPYPHNAEQFEERIVACLPHLGDLLVFTETRLHRLSWSPDGAGFSNNVIQDRLSLSAFDKESVLAVQNMIYFRNGMYYYMIVPRSAGIASPNALQLASISTPITNMLDRFQGAVSEIFARLYNPLDSSRFPAKVPSAERRLELIDCYSFLDHTKVRNVYKYRLADQADLRKELLCVDLFLNYDLVTRAWSTWFVQSNPGRLMPYRQTVTDNTEYVQLLHYNTEIYDTNGDLVPGQISRFQFIKQDDLVHVDDFYIGNDYQVEERLLKNHQLLDTGYREHQSQVKKRYREIQFKVANLSQIALQFGTEFYVDDQRRTGLFQYVSRLVQEGDLWYAAVEPVFDDPRIVQGATILDDEDALDAPFVEGEISTPSDTFVLQSRRWTLDVSQLSNVTVVKVRLRVSGKGYSPRLILVSFNDDPYELLSHNWVYRSMNAR